MVSLMTKKIVYGTITSIAFVLTSLTIPMFLFPQEASAGVDPEDRCSISSHPIDPLEVRVEQFTKNDKFRTLIVEKEAFDCSRVSSFVRDTTVIIDKVENKFGRDLSTTITVVNCNKTITSAAGPLPPPVPECSLQPFANTLSTDIAFCEEGTGKTFVEVGSTSFPTTIGGNPSLVTKYVIVEKEVLLCWSSQASIEADRILEVFNIEEIVNQLPTITQHTIICEKKIQTGSVIACQDFGTSIITPNP